MYIRFYILNNKTILINVLNIIILSFLCLAFMMLTSPAHAAKRSFTIGNYEDIQVEGDLIINIATGKNPSVSATGSSLQLRNIKINRSDRTLKIQLTRTPANRRVADINSDPLIITINTGKLKNIFIRGSATVNVDSLKNKKSNLTILGSGTINIKNIAIDTFKTIISGNGTINIDTGDIRKSTIFMDGNGTVAASKIITEALEIEHNGPANSSITVSKLAKIINNGAGRIEILGKANCLIKTIGSGKILCDKRKALAK